MRGHRSHRGLIGGILGVCGVLGLTYWLGGLLGLRGGTRLVCMPAVFLLLMVIVAAIVKG